jgi:rhomboid-like protein
MISKLTGLGSIKTAAQAPKPIHSFATAMATNSATQTSTIEAVSKATGIIPSLGASGAIYAALVVTALGFPDAQLALAIPPSFPIPIQTGVGALVLLDVVGIARGWRWVLDHSRGTFFCFADG